MSLPFIFSSNLTAKCRNYIVTVRFPDKRFVFVPLLDVLYIINRFITSNSITKTFSLQHIKVTFNMSPILLNTKDKQQMWHHAHGFDYIKVYTGLF